MILWEWQCDLTSGNLRRELLGGVRVQILRDHRFSRIGSAVWRIVISAARICGARAETRVALWLTSPRACRLAQRISRACCSARSAWWARSNSTLDGRSSGLHRLPRIIPVPGDVSDWGTKLVDLKGVAKPPPFSGDDADWFEWKLRFKSLMGHFCAAEEMKFCAAMHEPVPFARLRGGSGRKRCRGRLGWEIPSKGESFIKGDPL